LAHASRGEVTTPIRLLSRTPQEADYDTRRISELQGNYPPRFQRDSCARTPIAASQNERSIVAPAELVSVHYARRSFDAGLEAILGWLLPFFLGAIPREGN